MSDANGQTPTDLSRGESLFLRWLQLAFVAMVVSVIVAFLTVPFYDDWLHDRLRAGAWARFESAWETLRGPHPDVRNPPPLELPFGLQWGAERKDVRAVLGTRFAFRSEETFTGGEYWSQVYGAGRFDGLAIERIQAGFFCDELESLVLVLPVNDETPLGTRWHRIYNAVTTKYGPPTGDILPWFVREKPAFSAPYLVTNGDAVARWRLENEDRMDVSARVEKATAYREQQVLFTWSFSRANSLGLRPSHSCPKLGPIQRRYRPTID